MFAVVYTDEGAYMSTKFRPVDGRICRCGKRINRYSRVDACAKCRHESDVKRLVKTAHKLYVPKRENQIR